MKVQLTDKAAAIVRDGAKTNRRSANAEASLLIESFVALAGQLPTMTGRVDVTARKMRKAKP